MTSGLVSLCYVSSARQVMSAGELEQLLLESRERNRDSDITGMLIHHDGSFMQVLEGPAKSIEDTFARIQRSRRHGDIIELYRDAVEERDFGEWRMACRRVGRAAFDELLEAQTSTRHELLREFARGCR